MCLRKVVLDTETTGLSHASGDRIVDVGCVELWDGVPTGKTFQHYVNPQRTMPMTAFQIHRLSDVFLSQFPPFEAIYMQLKQFIQDSPLVIHNAPFDLGFLNAEFLRLGELPLSNDVIDTLPMAKQKFPGSPANLDALCRKFHISLQKREIHSALEDAHLLSQVYFHLDKQQLSLQESSKSKPSPERKPRPIRVFPIPAEEEEGYEAIKNKFGPSSRSL
jgi:DNA polymerase-3 subunit epsilon